MVNAFISSTGRDLADYRAAVIEICNRAGVLPIAMEFFESMGAGATDGSRRKLEEADVYVGIFAHRYGYIEDGQDRSVTEIEFDYAGERGLERLCFLVKQGYPWPPDAVDHENYKRLENFKARIDRSVIRNEFTTVDDLKVKVLQTLHAWIARHAATPASAEAQSADRHTATPPPAPPLLVGRDEELEALRRRVGSRLPRGERLTIIRGWPGVGKTTLVNALAHDPAILARFPDGVFWIALGENAVASSALASLDRQFGASVQAIALAELVPRLRATLAKKAALLILDDAWRAGDASAVKQVLGPDCSLVVTTRVTEVARELADLPNEQIFRLGVLSEERGLELLRRLTPSIVQQHPEQCLGLIRDLEGLPLAIRVAGRLLDSEMSLGGDVLPLMDELKNSHRLLDAVAPDDRFDLTTGTTPTVRLLLKTSSDRLDATSRERFACLGAFAPKPATFDLDAMKYLWQAEDPLPTVRILVDRGLLESIVSVARFQMHALLVKHAQSLLEP